ncbi:MAG TPA: BatA domain-containing protein [Pirellulales bacterium]|jgi:hypothetical protein|nr:BatA domain-containing protein [Pirellulales bacterium]
MTSFVFPSLLWFLPLIGLPILIHLINLLRHRRIRWAAMEFLLQSQKRNRTWIMLKQLLLLLLRMMAIAAVVLMIAQPRARNSLAALLGGSKTHQIVILDDSYSMSDHWGDTSAFKLGVDAVNRLGAQLTRQSGQQEFTLLSFSQASRRGEGLQTLFSREPVDSDFKDRLNDKLASLEVSETAAGPGEALAAVEQMIHSASDSATTVYLISDFRAKDWANAAGLRKAMLDLNAAGAQLQLIDCVSDERPNLAISTLQPGLGIRAAEVPLKMEVGVTNYSPSAVHDVVLQLAEDGRARPAVAIASIGPRQTATANFEVRYRDPGQHTITARLSADAIAADNARYSVLDFPQHVPVLVIDGDPRAMAKRGDAYFIALPFASSQIAPTGIQPQIEPVQFLVGHPLDPFHVIYLLNIDRLDQPEIDTLEDYLRHGGGVVFFLGERTNPEFMNSRLYRDGKGPFPVPLVGQTELLVDRTEPIADITVDVPDHPVFSVWARKASVDIDRMIIDKYFAVQKNWLPAENSTARVLVRLRNGAPLVVERKFGDGRVMAFLTTAAPRWNNLANTPRDVAAMLQLTAYISAARQTDPGREVGAPLEVDVDRGKFQTNVKFTTPRGGAANTFPTEAQPPKGDAAPSGSNAGAASGSTVRSTAANAALTAASPGDPKNAIWRASLPVDTAQSGFYEAQLNYTMPQGASEIHRFAYNVNPDEGNLKMMAGPDLESRLAGVKYHFHQVADAFFDADNPDQAGFSRTILYMLIALLVGEQLLAYAISYHPSPRETAR